MRTELNQDLNSELGPPNDKSPLPKPEKHARQSDNKRTQLQNLHQGGISDLLNTGSKDADTLTKQEGVKQNMQDFLSKFTQIKKKVRQKRKKKIRFMPPNPKLNMPQPRLALRDGDK